MTSSLTLGSSLCQLLGVEDFRPPGVRNPETSFSLGQSTGVVLKEVGP